MTETSEYLQRREQIPLPGADLAWLRALRDRGAARFEQVGFPGTADEDWRYTNTRAIQRMNFVPATGAGTGVDATVLRQSEIVDLGARRVVLIDGYFSAELSDLAGLQSGVKVKSLAEALVQDPDEVEMVLGRCDSGAGHGFTALNTAYVQDGLFLQVEDGTDVEQPVEVLFVSTGNDTTAAQPRNVIALGAHSRVSVIERFLSVGTDAYLNNTVSEILVQPSASIEHTVLQEENGHGYHVGGIFVRQHENSRAVLNNVALGGAITRTDTKVALGGEGAHCEMNGLYIGNGRQHIDNFTGVYHEQPGCSSDEYYKGVLDDRSRAVFHGRIVVCKDAQKTDAQQQNRNLLLSADAEIDTKPQLEIYADDVKCSHGATVGQLDENEIFYLRSRGVDEQTARSLLTYAFANDVISRFGLEAVRNRVEHALTEKLFHIQQLEELV